MVRPSEDDGGDAFHIGPDSWCKINPKRVGFGSRGRCRSSARRSPSPRVQSAARVLERSETLNAIRAHSELICSGGVHSPLLPSGFPPDSAAGRLKAPPSRHRGFFLPFLSDCSDQLLSSSYSVMTEPMANVDLEHQIQNFPQNKESEAAVECGDLQTLTDANHVESQSSEFPVSADLINNPTFTDAFSNPNMANSDKVNDMPSEMQTNCTPSENALKKQTEEKTNVPDDKPAERQTDDQVKLPTTGVSLSIDPCLANSEKVGHTPMEKVEHYVTPLDEQRDNELAFPNIVIPPSADTLLKDTLADKSEKVDATSSKQSDSTNLEKESDITSLGKQVNQVTVPMTINSEFSEASAEHNLDGVPLQNQINGRPCGEEMKDTLLQTDSQAIVSLIHMETEMQEPVIIPLENKVGSVETNMQATRPEDVHTKTPLKENNTGEDSTSIQGTNAETSMKETPPEDVQAKTALKEDNTGEYSTPIQGSSRSFIFEPYLDGNDSGSEDEQAAFMKELENFHQERSLDFKAPKFYGEPLNCLKLWRTVTRLGGYDQVTACKLWRQVGESFNPPKTCTTISWSFRMFYEKALLEYEKHKYQTGELKSSMINLPAVMNDDNQVGGNQASGSGRARRDAAARAMQVWHTQRLLDTGDVGDSNVKDKNLLSSMGKDKQLTSSGKLKRKPSSVEPPRKVAKSDSVRSQGDIVVSDVGSPADWVKINVLRTNEFFEVYALVPGLLREEVQVQSDPVGRLIISGEPEYPDNPWGVTPFKKVITLPTRIDPYQTSAVVTLHGQLFVRAPIDLSDV